MHRIVTFSRTTAPLTDIAVVLSIITFVSFLLELNYSGFVVTYIDLRLVVLLTILALAAALSIPHAFFVSRWKQAYLSIVGLLMTLLFSRFLALHQGRDLLALAYAVGCMGISIVLMGAIFRRHDSRGHH